MAWINVIAILFLGNTAVKIYKDYNEQKKMKITPVFDGDKLGLKNVSDAWSPRYNKK
jgi:AGCS family alanine or glycine:cation symporter